MLILILLDANCACRTVRLQPDAGQLLDASFQIYCPGPLSFHRRLEHGAWDAPAPFLPIRGRLVEPTLATRQQQEACQQIQQQDLHGSCCLLHLLSPHPIKVYHEASGGSLQLDQLPALASEMPRLSSPPFKALQGLKA